ncbi:unnamed protein product, partial [Thlaspi arvense]
NAKLRAANRIYFKNSLGPQNKIFISCRGNFSKLPNIFISLGYFLSSERRRSVPDQCLSFLVNQYDFTQHDFRRGRILHRNGITKDGITHSPKILTRAVNSTGSDQLSQGEKVLNWQTENALAQNQLLTTINHKIDQLTDGYNKRLSNLKNSIMEIYGRLNNLHQEMITMAQHMMCDVCEKAPATVICCADEAALCPKCDVEIHAANKLASKHQRLHLNSLSTKFPRCDRQPASKTC